MRQTIFWLLGVLIVASGCQKPQGVTPEPIPAGYDFPANRQQLQALTDSNDVKTLRVHAWNLWAGMTADSKSKYRGDVLPIWETWLATAQVFTDPPTERPGPIQKPPRMFLPPSQFTHGDLPDSTVNNLLVGFNKYDPEMVEYLWDAHAGPGGQEYFYTDSASIGKLNSNWPDTTSIANRKIADSPPRAIELKPVMMMVKSDSLTALPFWQGPNASTEEDCQDVSIENLMNPRGKPATDCHPDPVTWTHCVIVDPNVETTSLVAATEAQFESADLSQTPACTDFTNAKYGGLNMLYNFELDSAEAAEFKNTQGGSVEAGDHAVLMAMHVNTKEIIDWTWQTYWWQGGETPPENYPGSDDDITANISTPWNYYAMCTAYSQTVEPNNEGQMRVCFNPFLETSPSIPDGIRSNCVSCHGTARYPAGAYPPDYSAPVNFGSKRYFEGNTKTDFSWAIPVNSK